ncbi:MAG TPA: hypothetical protein VIJ18_18730 [Microbacteriaceae bacterium]
MDDRKRGNPAGHTNAHVAVNLRKVRQAPASTYASDPHGSRRRAGVTPREAHEKRIATHRERLAMINGRQLVLDPMAIPIDG